MMVLAEVVVDFSDPGFLAGLAGLGFMVGILTGLFGVGGGFLIVPGLAEIFGIPYDVAAGSSLAFTVGTGASGASRHLRLRNVDVRSTLIMGGGAVVGAWGGKLLQDLLKRAFGAENVGHFQPVMAGLFIVLLLLTAWTLFRGAGERRERLPLFQRMKLGPKIALPHAGLAGVSLPGLILAGMLIGVLTGLLGIGGGVLFVPLLIMLVGLTPHQAVGTSLGVVLLASASGTIAHGLADWNLDDALKGQAGHVNLILAMALLVGSTLGLQVGAYFCNKLHAKRLRESFAIVVFLAAVAMAAKLTARLV